VHPNELLARTQAFFPNKTSRVHAFKQYGVIVAAQALQQRPVPARLHDEGQKADLPDDRAAAFVVVHLVAIVRQFRRWLTVAILEAMQDYFYALGMERFNLVVYHNYTAVVGRVRNIEGYNV